MLISFTVLLGTIGYLCYKSKNKMSFVKDDQIETQKEHKEDDDDIYKDLENLFI